MAISNFDPSHSTPSPILGVERFIDSRLDLTSAFGAAPSAEQSQGAPEAQVTYGGPDVAILSTADILAMGHAQSTPEDMLDDEHEGRISLSIVGEESTSLVQTPELLHKSRRLVADVYCKWGYVQPGDLTREGYLDSEVDPHVKDSDYFVHTRGEKVVATARLIAKDKLEAFPALSEFDIDEQLLRDLDGDPSHYREISALAKAPKIGHRDDVLRVYASMMQHSINTGGQYLLMSVDTRLSQKLKQLFGTKSFTQLGEPKYVLGSDTVPMVMDAHRALRLFDKRFVPNSIKDIFREGLQGLDASVLDNKTRRILQKHNVVATTNEEKRQNTANKWTKRAIVGLFGYTALRASVIPATELSSEGVNTLIFLGIDAATVVPYVEGMKWYATAKSIPWRIGGAAVTGASFMAPYAYAAYEAGASESLLEAGGIWGATLCAVPGIKKAIKVMKKRRADRSSRSSDERNTKPVERTLVGDLVTDENA